MPLGNVRANPLGNPLGLPRTGGNGSSIGDIVTRLAPPAGQFLEADGRQLSKAVYPKLFAAIGDAYSIVDFSAGFTAVTLPAAMPWAAIAYGNGVFVVVGNASGNALSADGGQTWQSYPMPVQNYTSITFGGGLFVAVASGSALCLTSPDGVTWTQRTMPASSNWSAVAYGGGRFVALGASGVSAYSLDGIIWVAGGATGIFSARWAIAYGNGIFVAVYSSASNSIAVSSPDGVTWTQRALPQSATWSAIKFGNGVFVAVGTSNTQPAISSDGINWTLSQNSMGGGKNISFASGWFVVFQGPTVGRMFRSRDGIAWTSLLLTNGLDYIAAVAGNGALVAIATGTQSAIRFDLISPTTFNIPKVNTLNESTAYIKVA